MKSRFVSVYLRLMKFSMLMGVLGGIAALIGPPHHGLIKAGIGIVIGAMILGNRLPAALKELYEITEEFTDDMFRE